MKAVVMAAGLRPEQDALKERFPVPLLPLGDRPFLQHVIEWVAAQEITDFHLVVSHRPEMVERHLLDGSRWGCRISYHLARDPARPYGTIPRIIRDAVEPFLLVHADRLPLVVFSKVGEPETMLFRQAGTEEEGRGRWTGWAIVAPQVLNNLSDETDEPGLERILAGSEGRAVDVEQVLSVCSLEELLQSQRLLLEGKASGLLLGGREVDPGIWISRNVMMHPTVSVTPPVFIGENCRLNRGVQIGPNVVVGADCVLDERSSLEDSTVFQNSFVGEHLELKGVVVDRNRLVNVRHGAVVDVKDEFILGNMEYGYFGSLISRLWSRAAAVVLLVFFSPLLLLLAGFLALFRSGPVWHRREAVRLPAPPEREGWRIFELLSFVPPIRRREPNGGLGPFCLRFLPALVNIARGELRFVGLPPRTPEEIEALPGEWKELYLGSVAGAITESFVHYGARADEDEQFAAEALYASRPELKHDLGLLGGYLWRVIAVR